MLADSHNITVDENAKIILSIELNASGPKNVRTSPKRIAKMVKPAARIENRKCTPLPLFLMTYPIRYPIPIYTIENSKGDKLLIIP